MNERGVQTIVMVLLSIIIVAAALPFLTPVIRASLGIAANIADEANFGTFTLKLPEACGVDGSTSIPGLKLSPNWHVMQFADFDSAQLNFTTSNQATGEQFQNITALEEECTDSTCLCLVYVRPCTNRPCETVGGRCKGECSAREKYVPNACDVDSLACRGGTEIVLKESIENTGECDSGVCCTPSGTRLYKTFFDEDSALFSSTLSANVYSSESGRRSTILNDVHPFAVIPALLTQDELGQVEDFTKSFLSSYECADQYVISRCKSLKKVGACTNNTLLTTKDNRPVLAFPSVAQKFDRVSITHEIRDETSDQLIIENVEAFKRT